MSKVPMPFASQTFDEILSQSIERYSEMTPAEAHQAIHEEWYEQMAALLEAVLFKIPCGDESEMRELLEVSRDGENSTYFYVPICSCEWNEWRHI